MVKNFQCWSIESTEGPSIGHPIARRVNESLAKLLALFIQFQAPIPAMPILFE